MSSKGEFTKDSFLDSLMDVLPECVPHRLNRIICCGLEVLCKTGQVFTYPSSLPQVNFPPTWLGPMGHYRCIQEDNIMIAIPYG